MSIETKGKKGAITRHFELDLEEASFLLQAINYWNRNSLDAGPPLIGIRDTEGNLKRQLERFIKKAEVGGK